MRRISVLFVLLAVCAPYVRGKDLLFGGNDFNDLKIKMNDLKFKENDFKVIARAHCEPATPVVGEPCAIILELDVDNKAHLKQVRLVGLPEGKDDTIVYGSFENLADGKSATSGHVVKRMRMPVCFQKPVSFEASLTVAGMVGTVLQGNSSFYRNFFSQLDPLRFDVQTLPEFGRPANFSGAVGRRFEVKQTLDRDHVQPNDLITATYTLMGFVRQASHQTSNGSQGISRRIRSRRWNERKVL